MHKIGIVSPPDKVPEYTKRLDDEGIPYTIEELDELTRMINLEVEYEKIAVVSSICRIVAYDHSYLKNK